MDSNRSQAASELAQGCDHVPRQGFYSDVVQLCAQDLAKPKHEAKILQSELDIHGGQPWRLVLVAHLASGSSVA